MVHEEQTNKYLQHRKRHHAVVKEEDEPIYKHIMEAIAAIAEEDFKFFTPTEDDPEEKMEDSTEVPKVFSMIFSFNDEPSPAAKYYPSVKFSILPQLLADIEWGNAAAFKLSPDVLPCM